MPAVNAAEFLEYLGDDAAKWAAEFCKTARDLGVNGLDEEWTIGWFANAIEHSHHIRRVRGAAGEGA